MRALILAAGMIVCSGVACVGSPARAQTEIPYQAPTTGAPEADLQSLRTQLARQEQAVANQKLLLAQARSEILLKDELIALGRQRNNELYVIAGEILDRYGDVDFREVLSRREPFVQSSRVRLENSLQDYEDRLRAARIYEETLPPSVERSLRDSQTQDAVTPTEPAPASPPSAE